MSRKKALSAAAAAAVTLVLLYLATRRVDPRQLWAAIAGARWRWVAVMAGIGVVDLAIRALRWRVLLSRARAGIRAAELAELEAIGLAINNVLPFRVGELARSFLGARELGLPAATVLASVAVERALDVAALLTLFCVASAGASALVPAVGRRLGLLVLAGAVGALATLAAAEAPLSAGGSWELALRRWPRVHDLIVQLAAGAAVLRSAPKAAQAAALSLSLWAVDAGFYWAGGRALGLGATLDYPRSVLVLSWAGAAAVLPTAPGGFGAFEAAVASIVEKLGAEPGRALAYAVLNHLVGYATVTAIGLACLYHVGVSLTELRTAVERGDA